MLLHKSRQLYQCYLEHHEGEGSEALGELCQSLQLYKRYLEHLKKEGNEALGRHGPLASGSLPVPAPLAPSKGAPLEEGVQDVLLEDFQVEQVVVKVPEISQGPTPYGEFKLGPPPSPSFKSHSFSPTGLPHSSSLPRYSPSGPGTSHILCRTTPQVLSMLQPLRTML